MSSGGENLEVVLTERVPLLALGNEHTEHLSPDADRHIHLGAAHAIEEARVAGDIWDVVQLTIDDRTLAQPLPGSQRARGLLVADAGGQCSVPRGPVHQEECYDVIAQGAVEPIHHAATDLTLLHGGGKGRAQPEQGCLSPSLDALTSQQALQLRLRPLALGDIVVDGDEPNLLPGHEYRQGQQLHIDQRSVLAGAPGGRLHTPDIDHLSGIANRLGANRLIVRHQFIQVSADRLFRGIPE